MIVFLRQESRPRRQYIFHMTRSFLHKRTSLSTILCPVFFFHHYSFLFFFIFQTLFFLNLSSFRTTKCWTSKATQQSTSCTRMRASALSQTRLVSRRAISPPSSRLSRCVCVCIHTRLYVCVCVCACMHACMYACMHVCMALYASEVP